METLQPSSRGAVASERCQNPVPRAESFHQETQTFMDSPPSTLSLDESLFCNTENAAESIIVLDDDDDQAQASTSRPRRANRRQLDYSYPDYEHLMNAVAARNPSRKRKRQKDSDALSLECTLVCIFRTCYLYSLWLTLARIDFHKMFEIKVKRGSARSRIFDLR
jgi:hypothetical protein